VIWNDRVGLEREEFRRASSQSSSIGGIDLSSD
jgi:hypothetical protein